jgi:succinylglutamate desuccinylase
MENQITIDRKAFAKVMELKEELDLALESLELMSDPEVVEAHKRAKEQIKNREFANWDDLQNHSN